MASSIVTNPSALTALQNLSATQKALGAAQSQVSSGLKVATAADNAAYWSISSILKSDTGALSALSDALNLGTSVTGTATAAIASTLAILNRIMADLVTARAPGASRASVQTDIAAQQKSLVAVLSSASFNGVNLLDGSAGTSSLSPADDDQDDLAVSQVMVASVDRIRPVGHPIGGPIAAPAFDVITADTTLTFVTSFQRIGNGPATLGTVALDTTATNLVGSGGVLNGAPGNSGNTSIIGMDLTASGADLVTMQADTEAAIASVTAIGAMIGAIDTTLSTQKAYVVSLSGAIASGAGSLVDADMDVASTRLQALQTQERLGLQSLSIANQNSRLILALFQAA